MRTPVQDQVYVWDPFVRLFHWSLVVGFTVAYLTEDDMLAVHVWAGYAVGLLIVARIVWGLVGCDGGNRHCGLWRGTSGGAACQNVQ